MKNFIKVCLIVSTVLIAAGCVQMRDHTGVRDGSFIVGVHQGFDQGADKKDYYIVKDGAAILIGDSKNEVIYKIGLPAEIGNTLEGYETWIYEAYGLELIFKGDHLGGWTFI